MKTYEEILAMVEDEKYEKVVEYLKENIHEEAMKQAGYKGSDITILKRLYNANNSRKIAKEVNPFEFELHDYYGACNGYYVLAAQNTMGYPIAEYPFNLRKYYFDTIEYKEKELNKIKITDKIRKEIKALAKLNKAEVKHKCPTPFVFEGKNGKIGINPAYLIDMLDFVGTDEILFKDSPDKYTVLKNENIIEEPNYKDCLYFLGEDMKRIGLLLPVFINK